MHNGEWCGRLSERLNGVGGWLAGALVGCLSDRLCAWGGGSPGEVAGCGVGWLAGWLAGWCVFWGGWVAS